jgi:hypothetical protein
MITLLPWIVIAIGIVLLIVFRFVRSYRKRNVVILNSKPLMDRSTANNKWMPIFVSTVVLLSALFIVLSKNAYDADQQKWAFGVIGTIIGYWLR